MPERHLDTIAMLTTQPGGTKAPSTAGSPCVSPVSGFNKNGGGMEARIDPEARKQWQLHMLASAACYSHMHVPAPPGRVLNCAARLEGGASQPRLMASAQETAGYGYPLHCGRSCPKLSWTNVTWQAHFPLHTYIQLHWYEL